jgi:uncharacterized protein (DUF488 family)
VVRLFTIGHGTRSVDDLAAALRAAGVERLVDVRRYPGSRHNPHLARESLERALPERGVAYEFEGDALGGRRPARADTRHPAWREASFRGYADHVDTCEFRDAFDRLLATAEHRPTAVMCAETLWWKCHRRLIADAAALRGVEVVHIGGTGALDPHTLHPNVRPDVDGWPVYDVAVDRPLS